MEKIKSISEAFSQQPITLHANPQSKNELSASEIKYELLNVSTGGPEYYYVGYNLKGQKIFQYLASSVNVQFFP